MGRKKKQIIPGEAQITIQEWRNNPIQKNRDRVFFLCIETAKAVIGRIQQSYGMQVKDYDGKVIDAACKLMTALDNKSELIPNNMVSWAYLYVLGVVFDKKLQQMEQELLIDDYLVNDDNLELNWLMTGKENM